MTKTIDFRQVQGNILLPYAPNQANCARFMYFRFDPTQLSANRKWLRKLRKRVTFHTDVRDSEGRPMQPDEDVRVNVGLTWSGLEALGYDPYVLMNLSEEFREGMRERAERLGDVLIDKEGKILTGKDKEYRDPVHGLVMVYASDKTVDKLARELGADVYAWQTPLPAERIKKLESAVRSTLDGPVANLPQPPSGTHFCGPAPKRPQPRVGSHVCEYDQDTYTLRANGFDEIEYFGFRDGISQPRIEGVPGIDAPRTQFRPDTSDPGTVLLGYPEPTDSEQRPATRLELAEKRLENGSFLVVRKLSQDVEGFHAEVEKLAAKIPNMDGRKLAELMVGRRQNGTSLVGNEELETPEKDLDDFDYGSDPDGERCPFQSHVRRSHPRDERSGIRRIMRRGMPYSRPAAADPQKRETGLMFLAYNTNLESQFEFVQRLWVNSGIENHGLSSDRDPITGEPPKRGGGTAKDDPEAGLGSFTFTSPEDKKPYTLTDLQGFVEFRWGDYFLVPSMDTLKELSQPPDELIREYERLVKEVPTVARARDILALWLDDTETGKRFWREVRKLGGVVRLEKPKAVLVGTSKRAKQVLRDDGSRFSVRVHGERMKQTTGAFYLGMDANTPQYQRESAASAGIIPGWKYDEENPIEKQLLAVKLATLELCFGFLGVSVVSAVANQDSLKPPTRGELDVSQFAAFVLSGLTPKLFGVPQPSAAGTFKMNVPPSGHIFFPFPPEVFREYADAAAKGLRVYLSQLFDERERAKEKTLFPEGFELVDAKAPKPATGGQKTDESWKLKLEEVLGKVEKAAGEPWSRDDHVRNMSGIISGMLIAAFRLFADGVSTYAKGTEIKEKIEPVDPVLARRLPFSTMRDAEASAPNLLYRQSMADQKLGRAEVREGDFVVVCQGSAMGDTAEKGEEWFYGDRTPPYDKKKKIAPHFCPGYRMADTILETMSSFLFVEGVSGLKDLERIDDTGEVLEYDWKSASDKIHVMEKPTLADLGQIFNLLAAKSED